MDFTLLDRYLESLLDSGLPMYDCVIHVEGKEIYRRQGGYIDVAAGLRHQPDTRYFMYSATKPVTCAAALTLLEAGKFRMGDPLYWYLPEYEHMQVADRK
ncbi:MAG: beta-lactamase family protein, partial [Clostridia bacterium]|nr:beta-lactamase family protein [Clostridia bacterium]